MRRLVPFLLLAFALGCGGSHDSGGPRGILSIASEDEELDAGVDLAGAPLLVGYEEGGPLRVVAESGTTSYTVPSVRPFSQLVVTGDFVLINGDFGTRTGSMIFDRRTGAARFEDDVFPVAQDGNRVVYESRTGTYVEDLDTAVQTPLPLADDESVADLAGNRALVAKGQQLTTPSVNVFTYRVLSLDGGASVALGTPEGYTAERPQFLNAGGAALGSAATTAEAGTNDAPSRIVLWGADGVPTVPAPSLRAAPLALADDGTALVQDAITGDVRRLAGGALGPSLVRANSAQEVSASRNGRYVFLRDFERGRLTAYRAL